MDPLTPSTGVVLCMSCRTRIDLDNPCACFLRGTTETHTFGCGCLGIKHETIKLCHAHLLQYIVRQQADAAVEETVTP